MRDLELLVVFDYRMTSTAQLAHYVIPPPLSLELPGTTQFAEALKYNGVSRGFDQPWAQYTPAIVTPPAGSEVIDEAEFFFRLAQRMRLQLDWLNVRGYGPHLENAKEAIPFDMQHVPSTEELIGLMCKASRIPLDAVKRHSHGHVFTEARVPVQPRDADCDATLELADPIMMADLGSLAVKPVDPGGNPDYPYRLVCRRSNHFMNSVGQTLPALAAGRESNPVYMHPKDVDALALQTGAQVRVRSLHGEIVAAIDIDASMKPGVVSIYHGFDHSVSRLIGMDEYDPITGIPRMSGVPVAIVPR
jgi:anaerobic selenocysteine-containing dehydrogenase